MKRQARLLLTLCRAHHNIYAYSGPVDTIRLKTTEKCDIKAM